MALRLVQFRDDEGEARVALAHDDGAACRVEGIASTLELAHAALAGRATLAETAAERLGEAIDLARLERDDRLLAPISHPDPAHVLLSGTGLTHLGSAEGRDAMHKTAAAGAMTDSMRMFRLGLEGGKPASGGAGAQPEWFYKGDGTAIVAPGGVLESPAFALDGGEEPEIAGVYLIDDEGTPRRLGFTLANEFSDHVTERGNYLWLAHSKLRPAALGPELLLGRLPEHVEGASRIRREGEIVWQKPFLSGEANMCHSLANLEHHHFKYAMFRRPGDVHVHFFGTATLSFADGFETREGDVFEVAAPPFLLPLRNRLARVAAPRGEVQPL